MNIDSNKKKQQRYDLSTQRSYCTSIFVDMSGNKIKMLVFKCCG